MSSVLVVEDEQHLADGLRFNLEAEGYTVNTVSDGEAALSLLLEGEQPFDAVVLDVMLPGKDGFTVASELRASGHFVPLLMLTARGRPDDVLRGFESGADDYLPKPFELSVFMARLNALLRRREWFQKDHPETDRPPSEPVTDEVGGGPAEGVFAIDGKTIDLEALELRTRHQTVRLTLMEVGVHEDTDTRAIDNFIVRLRKYLEDEPSRPRHLLTVRGVGYRFVAGSNEG